MRLGELNLIILTYINNTWYGEASTYIDEDTPMAGIADSRIFRSELTVENNSIVLSDVPIQDVTLTNNCVVDIPTNYSATHVTLNVLPLSNIQLTFIQGTNTKVISLQNNSFSTFEIIMNGNTFKLYKIN